jgi:hypothetical protein
MSDLDHHLSKYGIKPDSHYLEFLLEMHWFAIHVFAQPEICVKGDYVLMYIFLAPDNLSKTLNLGFQ